jgi:tetratricopeptide (TPR) repeat protein
MLTACCPAQPDQPRSQPSATQMELLKETIVQSNAEAKVALLNQFRSDLQKAELIPWVYDQICESFGAAGQLDRAFAAGEHLMDLDPQNVEIAQKTLKIAEQKKDPAAIRRWSELAARAANIVIASPDSRKGRVEFASSVLVYTEYLAYAEILATTDPARKRQRIAEFLEKHKDSCYRSAVVDLNLEMSLEGGNSPKALEAAKHALAEDENNVLALTIVADSYLQSESDPKKLIAYANKIQALVARLPKPEGFSDSDWSRKKALLAARAHWMIGTASMQQDKFTDADKSIRAALPYLKGNARLTSAALFYLGWANYRMGNFSEAIRFNKQCMLVKGPYQEQAEKNLRAISAEAPHN